MLLLHVEEAASVLQQHDMLFRVQATVPTMRAQLRLELLVPIVSAASPPYAGKAMAEFSSFSRFISFCFPPFTSAASKAFVTSSLVPTTRV